jgi:hypothetical protein
MSTRSVWVAVCALVAGLALVLFLGSNHDGGALAQGSPPPRG